MLSVEHSIVEDDSNSFVAFVCISFVLGCVEVSSSRVLLLFLVSAGGFDGDIGVGSRIVDPDLFSGSTL